MTITQSDVTLLYRIRSYLPHNAGQYATHAVYRSPAQELRLQADRIEQQEADEKAFDDLISKLNNFIHSDANTQ